MWTRADDAQVEYTTAVAAAQERFDREFYDTGHRTYAEAQARYADAVARAARRRSAVLAELNAASRW